METFRPGNQALGQGRLIGGDGEDGQGVQGDVRERARAGSHAPRTRRAFSGSVMDGSGDVGGAWVDRMRLANLRRIGRASLIGAPPGDTASHFKLGHARAMPLMGQGIGGGPDLPSSPGERRRTWLLSSQSDQRIHARGAASGYGAGDDRDGHE